MKWPAMQVEVRAIERRKSAAQDISKGTEEWLGPLVYRYNALSVISVNVLLVFSNVAH